MKLYHRWQKLVLYYAIPECLHHLILIFNGSPRAEQLDEVF